jgi:hypothetical protein
MKEASLGSGAMASPAVDRAGAADGALGSVRVSMFPPVGLLEQGPEATRAFLAQVSDAGIDHICCGDHVSFVAGAGFDGMVQATALVMAYPALPVHFGVYLLPLRHPVLVARQLADIDRLSPGRLTFGVGVGGEDRREVSNCGVDPATRGAPTSLDVEPPGPVPLGEARAAGARSRLRAHPEEHPYPSCFVCGPHRRPGDGLRILVGPVADRDLSADIWYPDQSLAQQDGHLRREFVWAALDCSGAIGAIGDAPGAPAYLLGRFSARQTGPVKTGEPYVVVGWRLAEDGRKLFAGSALFTAAGQLVGLARATWIRMK